MISKNQIKFVRQLEQKKYRQREGLFVAEGPKVVGDLLRHGWQPKALYATSAWEGVSGMTGSGMVQVSAEELQRLSFLQHPQQVLAVFPMPENREMPPLKQGRLYLALDGVQDPGNLGTIIRIADWFGINTIYCSTDTADVWNPKVVQATMGSIARVSLYYTDLPQMLKSAEVPVYGTLLDGENIYSQSLSSDGVIVMGNEGNGLSAPVRELVDRKLLIPSFNSSPDMAESLNVAIATAITCSEFRRR
jgi:TrmH family RNA methyltransferase